VSQAALRFRTKLLYASDSLGSEALLESRGLWLLYYYAPPAWDAAVADRERRHVTSLRSA